MNQGMNNNFAFQTPSLQVPDPAPAPPQVSQNQVRYHQQQESGDITFLLAIPAETQKCMQKRMRERTNSSVNWEEEVQNMYLTQGDIDAQEEKVSKLKAMVDIFSVHSAPKRNLSGLLDSMIDNIVNGRSKRSDGEMEVRSFYGLESTEKTKIQKLSSLAVEGERIRM